MTKLTKKLTFAIGLISMLISSFTSISSCFWFSYEPQLPQKSEDKA